MCSTSIEHRYAARFLLHTHTHIAITLPVSEFVNRRADTIQKRFESILKCHRECAKIETLYSKWIRKQIEIYALTMPPNASMIFQKRFKLWHFIRFIFRFFFAHSSLRLKLENVLVSWDGFVCDYCYVLHSHRWSCSFALNVSASKENHGEVMLLLSLRMIESTSTTLSIGPLIGHVCQILSSAPDDEENNQFHKFVGIENGSRVLFDAIWIYSSSLAIYPQLTIVANV